MYIIIYYKEHKHGLYLYLNNHDWKPNTHKCKVLYSDSEWCWNWSFFNDSIRVFSDLKIVCFVPKQGFKLIHFHKATVQSIPNCVYASHMCVKLSSNLSEFTCLRSSASFIKMDWQVRSVGLWGFIALLANANTYKCSLHSRSNISIYI